ncbi:MAG: CubicO group peptidase (beta-lactamase class C family) [Planctomycetota bacterium]|jgi:CubicO group peptidase (beta-lactamase class C family)
MKRLLTAVLFGLLASMALAQEAPYYPGTWPDWEAVAPGQVAIDQKRLDAAVTFAKENFDRDGGFDPSREPYGATVGPTKPPSGMNGLILVGGRIVAEWGDTREVDMTFSVTKTYLSTTAGLAFDDGLIRDVQHPVRSYVQDGSFDAAHNRPITWHQLLNQTSGWEGTLWGKPDWADRYVRERRPSELPGQHWRYNDVRVNQLALSLMHVFREPLPRVLKTRIMDVIGCSPTWRWHGYENSWVTVDGLKMQSVSGGGHWGGGMFISSRDHARFGLLMARNGKWRDRQLLSSRWIEMAKQPTKHKETYGYMNWFLNTDKAKQFASAPVGDVFFLGAGTNMVWLCPSKDMVVVVRWMQRRQVDAFCKKVLAAFD